MGHLLLKLDKISEKQINKFEKECKDKGKSSFHFAWVMDENIEERKRGVTIDVNYKYAETDKYRLTLIDAPGHKDFIPNLITGLSQAEVALLIIDAGDNSYEIGLNNGQTIEHSILAYYLGVQTIICVVNKMDKINWDKERYNFIQTNFTKELYKIGFNDSQIKFIGVSGFEGSNLTEKYEKWDNCLIDIINSIELKQRNILQPERLTIIDSFEKNVNNMNGLSLFGKVESGCFKVKGEYLIQPINLKISIRSINCHDQNTDEIIAGECGEILLSKNDDEKMSYIK